MMQAEPYRVARKLAHTSEQAMQLARNVLASNGFAVESLPGEVMNATGPGMRSNRQNPLLGAKHLTLRIADGHIAIDADLSSMRKLSRFVYWFPWGLSLVLGITLGTIFGFQFGSQTETGFGIPQFEGWKWMVLVTVVGLAPALPWLILSPLIARSLERRTKSAIDTFCVNVAG